MTVRASDFYGGALENEVTGSATLDAVARHMTFWGSTPGTFSIAFKTGVDLSKRMDYTWLGGPVCFLRNESSATLEITFVADGDEVTINMPPNSLRTLCLVESNRRKPNTGVALTVTAPQGITSSGSTGMKPTLNGFVHNGGSPGGTSCESLAMPTGTWSSATASTNSHGDAAGFGLAEAVHLVGHNSGTTDRQKHSSFRGGSWTSRTDAPIEMQNAIGAGLRSSGLVFSADSAAALLSKPVALYDYDVISDTYSTKAAMPHAAERGAGAVIEEWDRVIVVRGDPLLQASWLYHRTSGTYESIDFYAGSTKRSMSAFFALGKVWSVGGYNDTESAYFDTSDLFDIATRSWSSGPTLPAARREGASLAWRHAGIYAGGDDNGGTPSSAVYRMNVSSSWVTTTAKAGANTNSAEQGGIAR